MGIPAPVAWSVLSIIAAAFAGAAIVLSGFLRKPETDPAGDQRA